jgi:hypothetical protein
LPWLKANVKFSERTAQAYMRVAKRWPELETKAQHVADLPYREALKCLADDPPSSVVERLVGEGVVEFHSTGLKFDRRLTPEE